MTTSNNPLFYQSDCDLPIVDRADGIYIWDVDGKRYMDACSGAITCNMGHNHKAIKDAMKTQLDKVTFSYRTQFESQPAIDLANHLVVITNNDLQKVFFVGSGSEAVESSIKLARQYFYAKGQTQRRHFVSHKPSYHGSTLGALSLTSYEPLEAPFREITNTSIKVPTPDFYRYCENSIEEHVTHILNETEFLIEEQGGDTVAAIVIEPVGGASTGARMLNQQYFDGIQKLCDKYGCLLILDEVLTGMGRTGKWLAYQHWNVKPDIVAMAKGLGAGYYPVAAMLARDELVDVVMNNGGFQHGHTYAGNPLACATGVAIFEAMNNEKILDNVKIQGEYLSAQLQILQVKYSCIGHVRGLGLLQCLEFAENNVDKTPWPAHINVFAKITAIAKSNGLLVYPRRSIDGLKGDHILITPPLTITAPQIDELIESLDKSLQQLQSYLVSIQL